MIYKKNPKLHLFHWKLSKILTHVVHICRKLWNNVINLYPQKSPRAKYGLTGLAIRCEIALLCGS